MNYHEIPVTREEDEVFGAIVAARICAWCGEKPDQCRKERSEAWDNDAGRDSTDGSAE